MNTTHHLNAGKMWCKRLIDLLHSPAEKTMIIYCVAAKMWTFTRHLADGQKVNVSPCHQPKTQTFERKKKTVVINVSVVPSWFLLSPLLDMRWEVVPALIPLLEIFPDIFCSAAILPGLLPHWRIFLFSVPVVVSSSFRRTLPSGKSDNYTLLLSCAFDLQLFKTKKSSKWSHWRRWNQKTISILV